jgi:hypothetical protein
MGGVVQAIWESLEGHVVQVVPVASRERRFYVANGAPQSMDNRLVSTAFVVKRSASFLLFPDEIINKS